MVYSLLSAKSCSHLKRLSPETVSGTYLIDPDGKGNLAPFIVTCDMTDKTGVGVTVVGHDSEERTLVDGCDPPGCYSRDIGYIRASLSQLVSLSEASSHCEQFIKYECFHSKLLKVNNNRKGPFGWWVSRNSTQMTYWGGAEPGSNKCACGMNNTCKIQNARCNCDQNNAKWREDCGYLNDKSTLPVTQLRFGDIGLRKNGTLDERGYHTLGKFKCYGTNGNQSSKSDKQNDELIGATPFSLYHAFNCLKYSLTT